MDRDFLLALKQLVLALGGPKKAGPLIWPNKSPATAYQHLMACLDSQRRERFSPDELIRLFRAGHAIGVHGAMFAFAGECGYSNPIPVTTEDERAELQKQVLRAVARMEELADKMEKIKTK